MFKNTAMVRAWKGQEPAWKVFWLWGVGALVVMNVLFAIDVASTKDSKTGTAAGHSIFAILYLFWLCVSLWRSSRASSGSYKVIARIGVAFFVYAIVNYAYFILLVLHAHPDV
jgi:hypothetical protein